MRGASLAWTCRGWCEESFNAALRFRDLSGSVRGTLRQHNADDLRKGWSGKGLPRQLEASLGSARECRVHRNRAEVWHLPSRSHFPGARGVGAEDLYAACQIARAGCARCRKCATHLRLCKKGVQIWHL